MSAGALSVLKSEVYANQSARSPIGILNLSRFRISAVEVETASLLQKIRELVTRLAQNDKYRERSKLQLPFKVS